MLDQASNSKTRDAMAKTIQSKLASAAAHAPANLLRVTGSVVIGASIENDEFGIQQRVSNSVNRSAFRHAPSRTRSAAQFTIPGAGWHLESQVAKPLPKSAPVGTPLRNWHQ